MTDIYIDGFRNIAVQGPVVRIELANYAGTSGSEEDKALIVSERIVMPVEAMLRLQASLTTVMNQLEEKGLLKKKDSTVN